MKARFLLLAVVLCVALVIFAHVLRQISFIAVGLAANEQTQELLRAGLEDQKTLAGLDQRNAQAYRKRFAAIRTMLNRLEIVALTGAELTRHVELVLLATVAAILMAGGTFYLVEQRARERRLTRLAAAIEALSRGDTDVSAGETGRDLLGRIAAIIEQTSRVVARDRKRARSLEHLSSWQEAARRHAHEIATPLTAAQLELARLLREIETRAPDLQPHVAPIGANVAADLDQLREFMRGFVSFAVIGKPQLRTHDLVTLVADFCTTFAGHWPNLALELSQNGSCTAEVDREMVRRVLVNLCSNAALALGEAPGTVSFVVLCSPAAATIDVTDSGPGIPNEVRSRLFEPYLTTRSIGEGMGLGLAISKKILLDHGGDLELLPSTRGAAFRLTFPRLTEPS